MVGGVVGSADLAGESGVGWVKFGFMGGFYGGLQNSSVVRRG